jgi:hypothetical protein
MSKIRGMGLGIIIWLLACLILVFTSKACYLLSCCVLSNKRKVLPLVGSTSRGTVGIYLFEYLWDKDDKFWMRLGYYGKSFTH